MQASIAPSNVKSWVFTHLPSVGYLEPEDYVVEDPIATRWKALKGIRCALPVRKKLDDLQIDVVLWCPYEDHKDMRPLAQQTFFFGFTRCWTYVRPYCLERVLRQFGHV
ncbi:hypothetical protein GmHk_15G045034 [Glycine max]|nr:hypothetical protein GmHk_15G045034 [Glycine max]